MTVFISDLGASVLSEIRVGGDWAQTGGRPPIELLAQLPSDECGCPEELWRVHGIDALIHFEEDGSCDILLFAGDWEAEGRVEAENMAQLRAQLFEWVEGLMEE